MKKILLGLILVLLVGCKSGEVAPIEPIVVVESGVESFDDEEAALDVQPSVALDDDEQRTPPAPPYIVKSFSMEAKQFAFIPDTITVQEGDHIELTVTSTDVDHGLAIPEFGVREFLSPGKEVVIEFVADKKGSFNFFCSVPCGSGHRSMTGTLIVE